MVIIVLLQSWFVDIQTHVKRKASRSCLSTLCHETEIARSRFDVLSGSTAYKLRHRFVADIGPFQSRLLLILIRYIFRLRSSGNSFLTGYEFLLPEHLDLPEKTGFPYFNFTMAGGLQM